MKHSVKIMVTMGLTTMGLASLGSANRAFAQPLPEGAGKQLVEAHCSSCHATNRISSSLGYSQSDWQALIATMLDLSDNPNQAKITGYLA